MTAAWDRSQKGHYGVSPDNKLTRISAISRAAEGADLHVASDIATMIEVRLGMGEGLSFYNLKTVEQRDRVRQSNPEVAGRVERLLRREMDRSRSIVRDFRQAIEKIADVLVKDALIDGEGVRRILRESRP